MALRYSRSLARREEPITDVQPCRSMLGFFAEQDDPRLRQSFSVDARSLAKDAACSNSRDGALPCSGLGSADLWIFGKHLSI
jgi:hypothetical protein